MKLSIQRSHIEKLIASRNGYLVLAVASMSLCLLLTLLIFTLAGRERIILVPSNIEKTFWVSYNSVSPEYLSEMTLFFAYMRLNVTPENMTQQRETLLRYTDPSFYEMLKTQLVSEADHISKQHVAVAFFPVNVKVDVKHLQAQISGDLKSQVGEGSLPSQRMSYLVSYRYSSGRLWVKSFDEVKHG